MNLIRVIPAKGSGLSGTEVPDQQHWPDAAFPCKGRWLFFCFL